MSISARSKEAAKTRQRRFVKHDVTGRGADRADADPLDPDERRREDRRRAVPAAGQGRFPTLLAASPYRFDNDAAPAIPLFLWRETGPIDWYLEQGYAYVHMDVRGTGRSGGEYRYQ